jgi:hypothetical protein
MLNKVRNLIKIDKFELKKHLFYTRQLDQRPSANKLLQHPFIRNCINPAMGSNNLAPLNPTPYQNFQYPF